MFQIKEDASPPISRLLNKDPTSKEAFGIVAQWMNNCMKSHPNCRPSSELQKPPRRLLHIGNEGQNLFLLETAHTAQRFEWLSLSYCWGGEPSIKLTESTMSTLQNGIPLTEIDQTIRDAVVVARALSISYIWIDALCIRQDKKSPEWNEEASKMNEIYGGSLVTLVAAGSDSVKKGFLKERDLNYIPIDYSTNPAGAGKPKLFLSPEWDDTKLQDNGPWNKRGWTLQEGLLPNRLLYYTSSQVFWKCCEEQRSEKGVTESVEDKISEVLTYLSHDEMVFGSGFLWKLPTFLRLKRFKSYIPANVDGPLLSHSETFRLWYDVVEEYTPRIFKNISDRLKAISGLARMYGDTVGNPTYVAGLWKEDLIRGLLWHVDDSTLVPKSSADDIAKISEQPPSWNFPSWTWASAGYETVKNESKYQGELLALSRIKNIRIDLVDKQDSFGPVKYGSITISGPLRRLPRLYNKNWASTDAKMSELERHLSKIVEEESHGSVMNKYSSPPGGHFSVLSMLGDHVHCLYLLVLEATGIVADGINVYRRAGVVRLSYTQMNVADSELAAFVKEEETSIHAQLGSPKVVVTKVPSNAVFIEVWRGNWQEETVTIV
jgi:hypothetical protein